MTDLSDIKMPTYQLTQDVLNVSVSCFKNYETPANPVTINLLTWIRSEKHRPKIEALRLVDDKVLRDSIKATLPAITPSGVFTYRKESDLVPGSHTRLIQFDIDLADNRQIRNYASLKLQISKLPFVAYCGLSASGKGYWGLVPIAYPERHGQHFDRLKRVFAHYGIHIDTKPRNVASLRGYSYDPAPYQSDKVMLFEWHDLPKPQSHPTWSNSAVQSRLKGLYEDELQNRLIRFTQAAGEGQRHETLLKAATVAGGYIGAGRLDEQTAIYALETVASGWPTFTKSQKTIRDGIRYGMTKPIYLGT
ncbi:BT4734/BF3469 family protein [Spirosoma spitsbergense]|uniref:BT4734/BF3469 family protein n=1 Tax=Spirosoma spitsbergense TaxID=431554 RepID=UPI00039DC923|nr:BT4734/BF3469 family protein [Spirosoma spitsbergense]